jgi:3-phosphoshikimate 1-carboxyvinyltransferase
MSFAIAGLKLDGIIIENPQCVSKSYPSFWEEIKKLEGR